MSGFFDLPKDQTCRHPGHEPPSGLYIPPGKGYRHICPGCGSARVVIPAEYTLNQQRPTGHKEST